MLSSLTQSTSQIVDFESPPLTLPQNGLEARAWAYFLLQEDMNQTRMGLWEMHERPQVMDFDYQVYHSHFRIRKKQVWIISFQTSFEIASSYSDLLG